MAQGERVAARGSIVAAAGVQLGCACLAVPAFENVEVLRQRAAWVGISHALGEVVTGDGFAVVAGDV